MRHLLTIDGKPTSDFGIFISGIGIYNAPERDVEVISIPGRNGDLTLDNGRFNDIEITYPCYIVREFADRFSAFKAYLLSRRGHFRLEDDYQPEHYRKAYFKDRIEANIQIMHRVGNFGITFICDPRRFLKSGDNVNVLTSNGSLFNPTYYDAKPLIRVYGTGSFTINDVTVTIASADGYTDIDCEIMDAYKGATNCNGNIRTTDNKFPVLRAGQNNITKSGISRLEITPRWWTV
jgi:phage-related protein